MQCSPSALTRLLSVTPFHSHDLQADRRQSIVEGKPPLPFDLLWQKISCQLDGELCLDTRCFLNVSLNHLQAIMCDLEDLDTIALLAITH